MPAQAKARAGEKKMECAGGWVAVCKSDFGGATAEMSFD